MIIVFKCANCGHEFKPVHWPLSSANEHFLQGSVEDCSACGLRQLLHPPQPATAVVISVDGQPVENPLRKYYRCGTLKSSGG